METNKKLFKDAKGRNYLLPFILITTLFFLWGFAHSILDVLNKHFQETMGVSKTESAFVQAVVYGGYFLMAIPAGMIIKRFGYRAGVITGLLLYGVGALLFIPGGKLLSFPFFLFSLFVIGCGLTCLETAANPYVTVLGNKDGAERRINLAQSFNGLGWIVGPLVGGLLLFSDNNSNNNISIPYIIIGVVVLCVAMVFAKIKLPEIGNDQKSSESASKEDLSSKETQSLNKAQATSLWKSRTFTFGLLALFLYVAAQTGINSFFINYVTDNAGISNRTAALLLSFGGMGLFMAGRLGGSWIMARIKAERVLQHCAMLATLSMAILLTGVGTLGIVAFFVCYLCESIMFPTIFAIALRGAGEHIKQASSYLIMSIVGGAIVPVLMGLIADMTNMSNSFIVPLLCFACITVYAKKARQVYNAKK